MQDRRFSQATGPEVPMRLYLTIRVVILGNERMLPLCQIRESLAWDRQKTIVAIFLR